MDSFIFRVLVGLSFLSLGVCQDEPEITQVILPEIKRAGETGRLNCTITRQGQNVVQWIRQHDQLLISGDDTIVLDDSLNAVIDGFLKFDVVRNTNPVNQLTTYTLIVRRLQSDDAGLYTCQVPLAGLTRILQTNGQMVVMVPPSIIHAQTTQTVTKDVGQNINLTCAAEAYPQPVIKWVRPNGKALPIHGRPFTFNSSVLPLRDLQKEDRGVYRCIADNNVPPAGLYDATLYIQFPPYARAVQTSYGQAANRQFDITLECRIQGNPEPNMQWFQREQDTGLIPITNDDRHMVHVLISYGQELSISEYWFQLTIINVLGNDFGKFICQGRNDLGTHQAVVELYETSECQGPNCPAEGNPSSATMATYSSISILSVVAALSLSNL